MSTKKVIAAIACSALLVAAFFISYSLSYKIFSENQPELLNTENTTSPQGDFNDETRGDDLATMQGEAQTQLNLSLPQPAQVQIPEDDTWPLTLINKYYQLSTYYEPRLAKALDDGNVYLDARVAEQFQLMYAAAKKDGIELTPVSGYVSYERQRRMFEDKTDEFEDAGNTNSTAQALAAEYVMPAGCSEDNAGFSVKIGEEDASFAETDAYKWLSSYAAVYGFTERYPADKESATQVKAQPWCWRYVGDAAAKAMDLNNLCLEEYLASLNS